MFQAISGAMLFVFIYLYLCVAWRKLLGQMTALKSLARILVGANRGISCNYCHCGVTASLFLYVQKLHHLLVDSCTSHHLSRL